MRVAAGGDIDGFEPWEDVLGAESAGLLDEEIEGSVMFYSSGTTGRPKGVRKPLSGAVAGTSNPLAPFVPRCGLGADTVYLSPAPLYHAAPLGWSLGTTRLGGQVVLLTHFDPTLVLAAVAAHRVTIAQLVPTMLARLVRLDRAARDAYDRSSLRVVLHAAAPCPRHVKSAAIDWLGPIVHEYYSGTEGSGITYITSEEWLEHPGSVGRPILGELHVTDEAGDPVPAGVEGIVWFGGASATSTTATPTRRVPAVTRSAGRRSTTSATSTTTATCTSRIGGAHMIVSGGVNISPLRSKRRCRRIRPSTTWP